MKILYVCHRLPFPPNRGGKIRPFNTVKHLSRQHEVVVASLAETEEELQDGSDLAKHCSEVVVELLPRSVRWRQACIALLTKEPSSVAYFRSQRLHNRIGQKLRDEHFDIVVVHCAFVAQYVLGWHRGPRWIDFGDLDSGKWEEYAHHRPFPLSLGFSLEATKLRSYEKYLARTFDHCSLTATGELELYKSFNIPTPCSLIPNGVDTTYFGRLTREIGEAPVIAFLGRMDYFPNIDGVVYFAREVLPIVRNRFPQTSFRIIGSNPGRRVQELKAIPGVTVTGHVPDVRPHLKDAWVAVAPLRLARGTQNKILESMAMGIPVVASAHAAKGVLGLPGQHLLVGQDSAHLAGMIIDVLEHRSTQERLSWAGRELVENVYQWSAAMKKEDNVLDDLLKRGQTGA